MWIYFRVLGVNQAAESLANSLKKDVNKKIAIREHKKNLKQFSSM